MRLKEYHICNLLDDYDEILKRCRDIESISASFDFIPRTRIIIDESTIVFEQEYVKASPTTKLNDKEKLQVLELFSSNLNSVNQMGFVHGDVKRTNVIFDGSKLILIDLEPSFRQIRHGVKVVMCSAPLRSLNDLKMKTVTSETDKIGFYLLCKKLMNIGIPLRHPKEFMNRRRGGMEFLPLNESEFVALSFGQIYDFFEAEFETL